MKAGHWNAQLAQLDGDIVGGSGGSCSGVLLERLVTEVWRVTAFDCWLPGRRTGDWCYKAPTGKY